MTLSEPQDYEFLFGKLAELLSFTQKGAAPKMMRWFSCNELWHIRSSEFWSLKMLLQHHLGGNRANDDWESMRDPAEMMQAPPHHPSYGPTPTLRDLFLGWGAK